MMNRTTRLDHYAAPAKLLRVGFFQKAGISALTRGESALLTDTVRRSSCISEGCPM